MGAVVRAKAETVDGKKMMFTGESGGHTVTVDYIPPLGEGLGFMPMQLYLVSLATCLGSTLRYLAEEHGKTISALTINVQGTRRAHPPTGFASIDFDMRVTSPDIDEETMKTLGEKAEKKYCPLTTMLRDDVAVSMTFDIVREG